MYVSNLAFAYSSPVPVYRILIIEQNGSTIIEDTISNKYAGNMVTGILVGGITSSINALFQEITKSKGDLQKIDTSETTILVKKEGPIFALLEAKNSTKILRSALDGFAKDFVKEYGKSLENFRGDTSIYKDYKQILKRYFPFLA